MAIPINVLVVEDSEQDTTLMMYELQRSGYEPLYERVETADSLRSAIRSRSWDLILSDYSMPQFNGLAALEIINGLKLNIPFIFVSGTQGEEAAVHMMKAGANDYIMKGQLSRLVPAIERELESAASRRARNRAEMAMQHMAAIVSSSKDAIYSVNLHGIIISWNLAANDIYGYQANEIIGQSIGLLFPANRHGEWLETMRQVRLGKSVGTYESERLRKDGRIVSVRLTVSPINDAKNKIVAISLIARDISVQKQAEQENLKLIRELTAALEQARNPHSLLPVCATCERVRDGKDRWIKIKDYADKAFSDFFIPAVCPECSENFNPNVSGKNSSDSPTPP